MSRYQTDAVYSSFSTSLGLHSPIETRSLSGPGVIYGMVLVAPIHVNEIWVLPPLKWFICIALGCRSIRNIGKQKRNNHVERQSEMVMQGIF